MQIRIWLALWLLMGLTAAVQAQVAQIGSVERLNGSVTVTPSGQAPRALAQGDALREGDLIVTAANAETLIKMRDDSNLALRQNSQLHLVEFKFDKAPSDAFAIRLLKGALRQVSGLIGKAQPRSVSVSTPTATVGIRGTDFEITIVEEESVDTRAGTYDVVFDGATAIQIASGESLDVAENQTGLALAFPRPGEPALQLIQGRPAFLRGGGFDAMMMQTSRPPMIMMPGRR